MVMLSLLDTYTLSIVSQHHRFLVDKEEEEADYNEPVPVDIDLHDYLAALNFKQLLKDIKPEILRHDLDACTQILNHYGIGSLSNEQLLEIITFAYLRVSSKLSQSFFAFIFKYLALDYMFPNRPGSVYAGLQLSIRRAVPLNIFQSSCQYSQNLKLVQWRSLFDDITDRYLQSSSSFDLVRYRKMILELAASYQLSQRRSKFSSAISFDGNSVDENLEKQVQFIFFSCDLIQNLMNPLFLVPTSNFFNLVQFFSKFAGDLESSLRNLNAVWEILKRRKVSVDVMKFFQDIRRIFFKPAMVRKKYSSICDVYYYVRFGCNALANDRLGQIQLNEKELASLLKAAGKYNNDDALVHLLEQNSISKDFLRNALKRNSFSSIATLYFNLLNSFPPPIYSAICVPLAWKPFTPQKLVWKVPLNLFYSEEVIYYKDIETELLASKFRERVKELFRQTVSLFFQKVLRLPKSSANVIFVFDELPDGNDMISTLNFFIERCCHLQNQMIGIEVVGDETTAAATVTV